MRSVTDSVVLPCTPEVFWRVFFDAEYLRALYLEGLAFKSFQILELGEASRKTLCAPRLNLPGPLEKLIGDSFAYEEHGTLDRAKSQWSWRMVQPSRPGEMAKPPMVATRGTMRIEAAGPGACRRSDEVIVEAKLFGVGGMIESSVEKEVRSGWSKELTFLARWLKRQARPA